MTSAEEYLGEILELYSEIRDLQIKIDNLGFESENSDDYEDFKESIRSYMSV